MKIKKNDQVLIIAGDDKGKKGKVIKSIPDAGKVVVEGANLVRKHVRPKKQGQKGQVVDTPRAVQVSNVKLVCPKCGKAARVGYVLNGEEKVRVCKKCGAKI